MLDFQKERLRFVRISTLLVASLLLVGCKSSEEKLLSSCIDGLEDKLETYAKYDGWSIRGAEAVLIDMVPDKESNARFDSDRFWAFEVIIDGFTVKNGFNSDVNSNSVCTGVAAGNPETEYESLGYADYTLNGKKLGL